MKQSQEVWC